MLPAMRRRFPQDPVRKSLRCVSLEPRRARRVQLGAPRRCAPIFVVLPAGRVRRNRSNSLQWRSARCVGCPRRRESGAAKLTATVFDIKSAPTNLVETVFSSKTASTNLVGTLFSSQTVPTNLAEAVFGPETTPKWFATTGLGSECVCAIFVAPRFDPRLRSTRSVELHSTPPGVRRRARPASMFPAMRRRFPQIPVRNSLRRVSLEPRRARRVQLGAPGRCAPRFVQARGGLSPHGDCPLRGSRRYADLPHQ